MFSTTRFCGILTSLAPWKTLLLAVHLAENTPRNFPPNAEERVEDSGHLHGLEDVAPHQHFNLVVSFVNQGTRAHKPPTLAQAEEESQRQHNT